MLNREDKAGLYITIIFHLVVVIILLIAQIGFSLQRENSFVIDFSREEELRRMDKNVTSSRNKSALKDDRNTDADQLYKDAEKLAKDLKTGQKAESPDDYVEEPAKQVKKDKASEKTYSGPSVLSWHLDGRKASHLPIPAYRCYGGGMVTVLIAVDKSGRVIDARIQEETSSDDKCLRDFAIRAARMSRFSAKQDAPAKQTGDIIYQFIAQ